ncbi:MAG TPA: fumarylacetoacetate hydrolase family protein, partial [Solirubrobacteraceae bacterium]
EDPTTRASTLGSVRDGWITPLRPAAGSETTRLGVVAYLRQPEAFELDGASIPAADVRLLSPVPGPSKIICVGLNYARHAAESTSELPEHPEIFAKFSNTVNDPDGVIELRSDEDEVDYEGELAVVIARPMRGSLTTAEARAGIGAYTIANDITARAWQFRTTQWVLGKSFDGYCPIGPWVVTPDEIPDPQALRIATRLNGETLQDASTVDMLFGVTELIQYIAQALTLQPGDVILTGTPEGVGHARTPPVYLRHGDTLEVELERIGVLRNTVVRADFQTGMDLAAATA